MREVGLILIYEIYEKIKDLDKDFINIVKLYGRIGFEAGRCISIVHRTGFLWGYFIDHDPFSSHNNAHLDNMIILPKETCLSNKEKLQIIAPIDFDMSFKKENSISFYDEPPQPDPKSVLFNMRTEFESMEKDLAGFYATVEGSSNFFKLRDMPPGSLCNVFCLMRDVAEYEYYQGYIKINSDGCKGNDISVDDIYKIIYR